MMKAESMVSGARYFRAISSIRDEIEKREKTETQRTSLYEFMKYTFLQFNPAPKQNELGNINRRTPDYFL